MTDWVLDASAVLAFVNREPGASHVEGVISQATVSAVNLAEVVTRLIDWGMSIDEARMLISDMQMEIASFEEEHAYQTSNLRIATRHRGLSLGDRACLALARNLGLPALTADRDWADLDIGVEVQLIRD